MSTVWPTLQVATQETSIYGHRDSFTLLQSLACDHDLSAKSEMHVATDGTVLLLVSAGGEGLMAELLRPSAQ
jgi:hypothetical protein